MAGDWAEDSAEGTAAGIAGKGAARPLNTVFQDGVPEMLLARGVPEALIPALLEFDLASFQFQRRVGKGDWLARILRDSDSDLELAEFQALSALARLSFSGEVTVGDLAVEMQLGPSRASRLAADLVAKGYLARGAAQQDGRKSLLTMTVRARGVFDTFVAAKWQTFLTVFDDWPEEDVQTFARLFSRYVETSGALIAQG